MAPDGTDQRRLTHTPVDEGAPTFSPDGKEIAYLVDPFGDPTIRLMGRTDREAGVWLGRAGPAGLRTASGSLTRSTPPTGRGAST
jgi:hypothetical protein